MRLLWYLILFFSCGCTVTLKVPKETYVTVSQPSYNSNGEHTFSYFLANEHYHSVYVPYSGYYVRSEKFKLVYDSLNPERNKIITWEPIFLPEESTVKVVGKIIDLVPGYCVFEYPHKDNSELAGFSSSYKRWQALKGDEKLKYPDFKIGQEYLVEYWSQDYRRAIIYFDKPIKEDDSLRTQFLNSSDSLFFLPNSLKVRNNFVHRIENKASDGKVKDVNYTVKGKNEILKFTINSFVFNADKLSYEPDSNTYKAEKVKLTITVGGVIVKGNELSYKQLSGDVEMAGAVEVTNGDTYINNIDEIKIDVQTGFGIYKKGGIEKDIMFPVDQSYNVNVDSNVKVNSNRINVTPSPGIQKDTTINSDSLNYKIRFDGIYQEIYDPFNVREFTQYIRFYPDGLVIMMATAANLYDLKNWFNKKCTNCSVGKYTLDGQRLNYTTVRDDGKVIYNGILLGNSEIDMKVESLITGKHLNRKFQFIKIDLN